MVTVWLETAYVLPLKVSVLAAASKAACAFVTPTRTLSVFSNTLVFFVVSMITRVQEYVLVSPAALVVVGVAVAVLAPSVVAVVSVPQL